MSRVAHILENAMKALLSEKYEEAISLYSAASEADTTNCKALYGRASSYALIGKYNEAANDAAKVICMCPTYINAYTLKGNSEYMLGRYEDAKITYQEALQISPNDQTLAENVKKCADKLEQSKQESKKEIESIIERLSAHNATKEYLNQADFVSKLEQLRDNPHMLMQLLQTDCRFENAFSELTGINFNQSPLSEKQIRKIKADEIKQKGNEYHKLKCWDMAIKQYDECIAIYNEEPIYYLNKAAALIEKGLYDDCLRMCDEGIRIAQITNSNKFQIAKGYARKAMCFCKMGNVDMAIVSYQQSYNEYNDPEIDSTLHKLLNIKNQQNINNEYSHHSLAIKMYNQGNFPFSIHHYTEAIHFNPSNPILYMERAESYCKLLEWGKAIHDINCAIAINPMDPTPYARKGRIHYYLREFYKAAQAFDSGMQADPLNQECKAWKEKVILTAHSDNDSKRYERAKDDPEILKLLSDSDIVKLIDQMKNSHTPMCQLQFKDQKTKDGFEKLWLCGYFNCKKE